MATDKAWFLASHVRYLQAWRNYAPNYPGFAEFHTLFPEPGDWLRDIPDPADVEPMGEWKGVQMSGCSGFVPEWVITRGCRGPYHNPVLVGEVPGAPVQVPLKQPTSMVRQSPYHNPVLVGQVPGAPELEHVSLHKTISTVKTTDFTASAVFANLDERTYAELARRCAGHVESFNSDMPPEMRTSALWQLVHFPRPVVSKPASAKPTDVPGFKATEWWRVDVDSYDGVLKEVKVQHHWFHDQDMSTQTYFHGAPFGAVLGMMFAGGFIPGPGMCRKHTRKVSGCFCSTVVADAFAKGTGHQLDFAEPKDDGDKRLNIYCMPCVVEIHPYDLVPTHIHDTPANDTPANTL